MNVARWQRSLWTSMGFLISKCITFGDLLTEAAAGEQYNTCLQPAGHRMLMRDAVNASDQQ